jgi:hypothetical protein
MIYRIFHRTGNLNLSIVFAFLRITIYPDQFTILIATEPLEEADIPEEGELRKTARRRRLELSSACSKDSFLSLQAGLPNIEFLELLLVFAGFRCYHVHSLLYSTLAQSLLCAHCADMQSADVVCPGLRSLGWIPVTNFQTKCLATGILVRLCGLIPVLLYGNGAETTSPVIRLASCYQLCRNTAQIVAVGYWRRRRVRLVLMKRTGR